MGGALVTTVHPCDGISALIKETLVGPVAPSAITARTQRGATVGKPRRGPPPPPFRN